MRTATLHSPTLCRVNPFTMQTIEEAQAAVERGESVHWKNFGYSLRKDRHGEWWVDCVNGFVAPLKGHKPEDFFINHHPTKKDTTK